MSKQFDRCVTAVSKRKGARDAGAICAASERKRGLMNPTYTVRSGGYDQGEFSTKKAAQAYAKRLREANRQAGNVGAYYAVKVVRKNLARRNPADESVAVYEEFHGKQPDEFITVEKQIHFHRHLAGAGELRRMVVLSRNHKFKVTMTRFGGAILAFNERKNQLFIEGGDQSVNLADFGITREPHEVETLGRVMSIDYYTTKTHLGEDGGTAIYRHKFRTTNELGKHVTVKIAEYPDLIYHVLDERLEFSGGSYTILREGIDL
jgi:hypothetical protein